MLICIHNIDYSRHLVFILKCTALLPWAHRAHSHHAIPLRRGDTLATLLHATNRLVCSLNIVVCNKRHLCLWCFVATKLHRIDSWSILGNILSTANVVEWNPSPTCMTHYVMCCLQLCCVVVATKLPGVSPHLISMPHVFVSKTVAQWSWINCKWSCILWVILLAAQSKTVKAVTTDSSWY